MLMHFKWLAAAVVLIGAASRGAASETPEPEKKSASDQAARIQTLIQNLSSEVYGDRWTARRDLFNIGRPALEALEYAAKSEDTSTRITANELLIELRGRGFMGIGLQEEQAPEVTGDETGETETDKPAKPPVTVRVTAISSPSQMGLASSKPFPAEVAGMATSDKILEVNGKPIGGVKDLMREVINIGPTNVALLMIERDGKKMRLPLLLTRNPLLRDTVPVDLEKEPESAVKASGAAEKKPESDPVAKEDKPDPNAAVKK